MPESISRAIMGHTLGTGEHGAYGSVPSLNLRAKWLAKIDPLLGIPRVGPGLEPPLPLVVASGA